LISTFSIGFPLSISCKKVYRYSFNGQERDDEIAGAGNIMTAEFWEYDTRLARRWNLDPVEYPWQSGYSTFNNNPNYFNDPFGLEGEKPGEQRTTSEGCNEVFNGKSWQDDQSSLKEILVTAARPQSKILKFLGEMDDAIHNPNSTISQIGQGIGRTITEFHPAVPIYNIGSRDGWWGNGNNVWDEKSTELEAGLDYLFVLGGSKKQLARLLGIYQKQVKFTTVASDVINNGLHFKFEKIHVALKVSDKGEILLGPAMKADAASGNIHEAIYAVGVVLQDSKLRQKVIDTATGFLNDGNLVKYPERIKEIEGIIKALKEWN